jgi:hypothetical protein
MLPIKEVLVGLGQLPQLRGRVLLALVAVELVVELVRQLIPVEAVVGVTGQTRLTALVGTQQSTLVAEVEVVATHLVLVGLGQKG